MTRILSLFVMFMLFGVVAFSQNRVVTGTVTDEKGAAVEGASVTIQGTRIGTATDQYGNFRLANVAPNATLEVTSVGVARTTKSTGTSGTVNVSVTRTGVAGSELATVTVGAFGLRQNARTVGTSRAAVSATQLTNGHPINVAQALSGKVSGLTINNTSSAVNGTPRVVIRGLRSITGDNTALIVLDGVSVPASVLNTLNPNDIERVDVLKGGQSATLFGSDGVNGALVITTKKGIVRKPEINFSNSFNIESLAYLPRTQHGFGSGSAYGSNPEENFHPAENQQYGPAYDGSIRPLGRQLEDGSIQLLPYSDRPNIRKQVWDKGYTRQTDLSYRAGDANSNFYTSYQNMNTRGIVPGDKYERNVFRMNAGRNFNKVGVSFDATYTFDDAKRTNSDYYFFALNSASWVPFTDYRDWRNNKFANPNGYFNDYYNNPYWELDNNRFNTRSYIFSGNVKLDYKATNDLTFTGRVAVAQSNATQTTTSNNFKYSAFARGRVTSPTTASGAFVNYLNNDYDRLLTSLGKSVARTPVNGSVGESQGTGSRLTFDAFGVHDKKFNKFSLRTVMGVQATIRRNKSFSASTASIGVPELYTLNNSGTGLFNGSNLQTQTRKIGAYLDMTLGLFNQMFFLHGSVRNDYSSLFSNPAIGFTHPNYPTYGGDVSFIVSDLIPSIKNKDNKYIDNIKLRAAYNVNGNDNFPLNSLNQTYPNATGFPYSGLLGSTVGNTLISPTLEPEEVRSVEGGIEIGMFNSRLLLEGSVYRQKANKQVLQVSTSAASGYTSYILNAANVTNDGYELDAKAIVYRSKNLTVNVNANYAYITNKVEELLGTTGLTSYEYTSTGPEASLNATVGQPFPYLKTTVFQRDAQGKIIIDPSDGWPERADARVGQGTTLPKHNVGVGFNIKYKNISFIANAEYRGGAVVYHDLGTDMAFTGSGAITAIYNRQQFIWPNSVYLDASGKSIPNTSIAVGQYQAIYQGFGDQGYTRGLAGVGEVFTSSADFWKVRDMSLNYDFPETLFTGKIIKGASVSFWGRNIFTWLPKDNWYTDPELSTSGGNALGINTSLNTPPARQLGGTIKLVF